MTTSFRRELGERCCTVAHSGQIGVNKQTLSTRILCTSDSLGRLKLNRALAATTAADKVPITGSQHHTAALDLWTQNVGHIEYERCGILKTREGDV